MEFIKRLEPVWLALVVVGALNWGMVGSSSSTSWRRSSAPGRSPT